MDVDQPDADAGDVARTRGRGRAIGAAAMFCVAAALLVLAVAVLDNSGRWVFLINHGGTVSLVLVVVAGILIVAGGLVLRPRRPWLRVATPALAAMVTLCCLGGIHVSRPSDGVRGLGHPPRVVAVSPDGRFEVVTRGGNRPDLWLRSRKGLFSRESWGFGCLPEMPDSAFAPPIQVEFTSPTEVTVGFDDGSTGRVVFDPATLASTRLFGGCMRDW